MSKKARLRETGKVTTTESSDIKVLEVSDEQLVKINEQTLVPFTKEQVFAFSVLLIDDAVTRNGTQYPESFQRTILGKEARRGSWVGLTMLMGEAEDHETKARNQKARIFDARLVKTPKGHIGTIGEAYIPINTHTEGFIESIKAGIHREVSIGVAVEKPTCSVCDEDIRGCKHTPNESYNGRTCFIVMEGDAEAQEVSFVAVPGSYHAQILSDTNGYVPLSEALGKGITKKEGKQMAKKKTKSSEFKELSNDINNLVAMLEKKLDFSESDDDEEDDELKEAKDNGCDCEDPDCDCDDDDDDDQYESADDDDDSDDSDDDSSKQSEADDDEDDDDSSKDGDDERKQTEALKSVFKSLRKMNEKFAVMEEQARNGRTYHSQVLKETLRLGVLSKTIPLEGKETFRKTFAKLSLEELLTFQKGYKVEVERLYPSTGKAIALTENKEESVQFNPLDISDIVKEFKN